ncbi:hypothetical protein SCP_1005220 [Sparassis crispa]|uniref:F-box domain-containing protein n=1 Tax=Sparassis crispa TaxID=139825 RepID=A0A401GYN4_9APHY|nr:hypothetical protein SCP_1005220 [Sparassis crispa]GBE87275.1 hypothetical protein SCP_1005220 [Sparassis crispa]
MNTEHRTDAGPSKPRISPYSRARPRRGRFALQPTNLPTATPTHQAQVKKCRTDGKLAQLKDKPLDIFLQIASYLELRDILQLSRTSKEFRGMFLTRRSRVVWVEALRNVPGLPECPPAISELAYAAILYDRTCMACGVGRATNADYALRVRFCRACYKYNVEEGEMLTRSLSLPKEIRSTIFSMLPTEKMRWWGRGNRSDQVGDLNYALLQWESSCWKEKRTVENQARKGRKESVLEKLQELGYTEQDFPNTSEWTKALDQPRELSTRVWNGLRPKLIAMIEQEKDDRARIAFEGKVTERSGEICVYYTAYLDANMDEETLKLMPNPADFVKLPSMVALSTRNRADIPISQTDFESKESSMLADIEQYQLRVERDLAAMLEQEHNLSEPPVSELPRSTASDHTSVLVHASAFFRCNECADDDDHSPPLLYVDVHDHFRTAHPDVSWNASAWPPRPLNRRKRTWEARTPWVSAVPGITMLVRDMLDTLGLPWETPGALLDHLVQAGQLWCVCGDPRLRYASTWADLVRHVLKEKRWYRTMCSGQAAKNVIFEDHLVNGANPCIKLLPPGETFNRSHLRIGPPSREDVDVIASILTSGDTGNVVCSTCSRCLPSWMKSSSAHLPRNMRAIAYHMKAKHRMNSIRRGDLWLDH